MYLSHQETEFCELLRDLPSRFHNVYSEQAANYLVQSLFGALVGSSQEYAQVLFGGRTPDADKRWSLREAQGAVEGAEYTEAARGHPCGHIFRNGETTYRCRTCSSDDTCVLCARCFEVSDHDGHNVFVSLSPGNSGCCDCGDPEAWIRNVECGIHSASLAGAGQASVTSGKAPDRPQLPPELVDSIRMTIARAMDYMCDVFSCSPEQLRLPKTDESVREDELKSRLPAKVYGSSHAGEQDEEFALVLWNDEKHTVNDVMDQVSRACKISPRQAMKKAEEVNDVGRSIVVINRDLEWLLRAAKIIEQPKLTVTIRSARDTFREQMCATIIEWIADIAGCSFGPDHNILRETVCEQLLRPWRVGSEAHHSEVGMDGLDDHEVEDAPDDFFRFHGRYPAHAIARYRRVWRDADDPDGRLNDPEDDDDDDDDDEDGHVAGDEMDVDESQWGASQEMEIDHLEDPTLEASEATLAGYPPPPPPPPHPRRRFPGVAVDSDDGESAYTLMPVPKTPKVNPRVLRTPRPPKYWLEKPELYRKHKDLPVAEDLERRVRLDYLILWDLRMWKQLRTDLRDVLISTVVTLSHFKRLLGLRFAGVYTVLAELYLIADREPDHSIINLSLQMLTTPSITAEIVERGNFLSHLLAILYTFLTTRQVGYPSDVNVGATLAFEQGAVTNRRTYHFYMDLKWLLASELVQERIRSEERYLTQFLDLAKLHQGICPNIRAVGEHVEFENDAWLSASIIINEIIKLCKLVGECFAVKSDEDFEDLSKAIRNTARTTITHSLGGERKRFDASEIRGETRFKLLPVFEFEESSEMPVQHRVVDYIISQEPISFHHALHYTLSWLIDRGKAMTKEQLTRLLLFSSQELRQGTQAPKTIIPETEPSESLLALFDYPLRVIAWLAQMRAGMWVRNGITLRHQMGAYRGHPRRELSFFRDIFMLQTAMVVLPPSQVLASMIDRFDLTDWIQGNHSLRTGQDEQQKIDIAEDFVHLLIVLLSDRIHLQPLSVDPEPQLTVAKRDITHTLCFKPLSFSSLCTHIPDKFSDTDQFDQLIQEMTIYRPPEGVSDHGTFALKDQYFERIDPYLAHFSRNQRDEAENIYKKHMANKLGKDPADVVYEPQLPKIELGLFKDLGSFTRTPLFAQIIFYLLQYTLVADRFAPNVPSTKVEQFLQFILHLTLVAVLEDGSDGNGVPMEEDSLRSEQLDSFCRLALTKQAKHPIGNCNTIARLLRRIAADETFKSCEPKVQLILRHMRHKRPVDWTDWMRLEGLPDERSQNASPTPDPTQDKEFKKKQAMERAAKVMAQFKQQQNSFMQNQAIDWGDDDFSDLEEEFSTPAEEEQKIWNYPSGTCILCQEETNEEKLYGTFALMNESRILRQTDTKDGGWVAEALRTPTSLDRSVEELRPFGVAGENRIKVAKVATNGGSTIQERQVLSKGFPMRHCTSAGPVASGCGHIMHYSCFEVYVQATRRRQHAAIARNHPETLEHMEFLCPLCKALGNAFLPVIWKGKSIAYPGVLQPEDDFTHFLRHTVGLQISKLEKGPERPDSELSSVQQRLETLFLDYGKREMNSSISGTLQELTKASVPPGPSQAASPTGGHRIFNVHNLSMMFTTGEVDAIPASALLAGMPSASNDAQNAALALLPPQLGELVRIYNRLRETMTTNKLVSAYQYTQADANDLTHTDTLARSLGYSISATEIAQRGVESDPGSTLLDKISSQSLTHLRVLSETVSSYFTVGALRNQGDNATNREFVDLYMTQLSSLFVGHPELCSLEELNMQTSRKREMMLMKRPLLTQDPFIFLASCSTFLQPAMRLDIHHLMRMCYTAEVVRVIASFLLPDSKVPPIEAGELPVEAAGFVKLTDQIYSQLRNVPGGVRDDVSTPELASYIAHIYRLAHAYALPFVRKCVVLMHVRYGVEFVADMAAMSLSDENELVRLSHAVRLPTLDNIATAALEPEMSTIITGWLQHWILYREGREGNTSIRSQQPLPIQLSHPAIFELVGLPKNFDTLQDEAMRRKCPTTGKDQTDPVVCLFCGEIFCSQAVCCKDDNEKGGCWQHRRSCGGPIGIFINIRKCMVVLLNGNNGSWQQAPYLDKHGETDGTLRRRHQLYLHQKRYDKLYRDLWLAHGVQSQIARRLEGESNNGGWETL